MSYDHAPNKANVPLYHILALGGETPTKGLQQLQRTTNLDFASQQCPNDVLLLSQKTQPGFTICDDRKISLPNMAFLNLHRLIVNGLINDLLMADDPSAARPTPSTAPTIAARCPTLAANCLPILSRRSMLPTTACQPNPVTSKQ